MTINHNAIGSKRTLLDLARIICLLSVMTVLWLCSAPYANAAAPSSYQYFTAAEDWGLFASPQASCSNFVPRFYDSTHTGNANTSENCQALRSTGALRSNHPIMSKGVCADGSAPKTQNILSQQCPDPLYQPMDANTACAGYPNLAGLAAADGWVREPRTYAYNVGGNNGIATVTGGSGTNGTYTYGVDCYQKGRMGDGDGLKLPQKTPVPAPVVDTKYPECGVGNYWYVDEKNVGACSQTLPDRTLADCGSQNGGYVNGKAVCLPANPAPTVAANAATTAQQKADAAVTAGRGTSAAITAANDAATAYRRAAEAANSMPTNVQAQTSAASAYASATQAAIAAGMSVPAPLPNPGTATGTGTSGNGTGTENTGPKECGSPGKPACKIDETGTPDGKGATDAAGKALDDATKAWTDKLTEVTKADGKDTSWGWFPALPAGNCTPFVISAKFAAIDWCRVVPNIQAIMQWIWATATIFACAYLVSNAAKA